MSTMFIIRSQLTISLLLFSAFSFAQDEYFIVTPKGIRNGVDTSIPYIVLSIDSTSGYLYTTAVKYIQETFKNPDHVIKARVENEYLRYGVYEKNIFQFQIKKQTFPINASYSVELKFKDGKLRIEFLDIRLAASNDVPVYWVKTGSAMRGWSRQHIFDTDGSIEHINEKNSIEEYFNGEVKKIKDYILKKEKW